MAYGPVLKVQYSKMPFLTRELQLTVRVLWLCAQLLAVRAVCPAPFSVEAGKCVFVNRAESFSWCEANRQCASIGGELINSYSSLQLLGSMQSFQCSCKIWLGVSDMADERATIRSGWQMILDKGILPLKNSLWRTGDPNNSGQNQDCVGQHDDAVGKLSDNMCSGMRGFACEFVAAVQAPAAVTIRLWQRTPFKRTSYNPSTEYCYTDLLQVKNAVHCVAAAMRADSSRHVLYNSKLRKCRMLQFTDAQVEEEIETSADWVKYSRVN